MRIAVAVSKDQESVTGHAGQCRRWLVYSFPTAEAGADPAADPESVDSVELTKAQVWHHFKDDGPHPLDGIVAVIASSAGDSFIKRMGRRGIEAAMTAQTDPLQAARDYRSQTLAPAKPRPIMGMVCKVRDLFSEHR